MSLRFHRFALILVASLMSFGLAGSAIADTKEPRKWKTITYKVKPGDTLGSIAQKYNTTPQKLMKWNRGLEPTKLQIGQPLKIAIINPEWKQWKASGGKPNKSKKVASKKSKSKKSKSSSKSKSTKKVAKKKIEPEKSSKPNKATVAKKKSDDAEPPKKIDAGGAEVADAGAQPPKSIDAHNHDHDHDHAPGHDHAHEVDDKMLAAPTKAVTEPGFDDTPDYVPAKSSAPRTSFPSTFSYKGEKLPVVTSPNMIEKDTKRAVYIVGHDDENIGSVALKFGLDPEDLLYWNNLDRVQLRADEPIVFMFDAKPRVPKKPLPTVHRVKRGDTYEKIAKKYGVSVKQLKRWNPKINPRRLQIGQTIRMYIPGRDGRSVSYGTANRGKLYNGVALESTHGLKVRTVSNAYGTERVVRLLKGAAFDVAARWPDAPNLVVGDISYRRGGRIKKHKSHQSGRDADVSFYYRGNVQTRDFVDMEYETFDAVKNWHIFKTLIDTGEVEYIFIDYPLQKILFEYARAIGYTEEELEPLIQYPRPKSMGVGIIRHVRGHDDHWHIRFKCGPEDRHCR